MNEEKKKERLRLNKEEKEEIKEVDAKNRESVSSLGGSF